MSSDCGIVFCFANLNTRVPVEYSFLNFVAGETNRLTNHLECELKIENLQRKSDKIIAELEKNPSIDVGKSNESSGPRWDFWGKPGRGWLYETPDKGHTIYKRKTGSSTETRELVQEQLNLFEEE